MECLKLFIAKDLSEAHFDLHVDTCEGKAVFRNLSVNSKNYYWDFGDKQTDTAASPVHFYKKADSFSIMLIAQYKKVCADTAFGKIYILTPGADALMDIDTCHFNVRFINPSK